MEAFGQIVSNPHGIVRAHTGLFGFSGESGIVRFPAAFSRLFQESPALISPYEAVFIVRLRQVRKSGAILSARRKNAVQSLLKAPFARSIAPTHSSIAC